MPRTDRGHRPLPLVRTAAFRPFLHYLTRLGTPVDRLLEISKLPVAAMGDPDMLIPLRNACRFLDIVALREGIPTLGFQVAQRTPVNALGALGLLVGRSVTLWEALHTAERLASTMSNGFRLQIEQADETVWIHHQNLMAEAPGSGHADAFGLMQLVNLIRLAAGEKWRPAAARLPLPHGRAVADLEVFRAAALQFGQATSAIAVPTTLLTQPLHSATQYDSTDTVRLDGLLQSTAPARDLCGSVKQFLRSQLPNGITDISAAAEAADASVRTLQRKLQEEGCDYSRLLDQTRFCLAVELLRDAELKILDIAHELGYGDAANFTRAFRRWTGQSPQVFRRRECGA